MTELMKRYCKENSCCHTTISAYGLTMQTPAYVAWLEAQLTWRPVSEPPKENVDVEVRDMSKSSLDEREPVIAYYEKGKWVCVFPYNFDVYAYITPTHWRYIPPAPKGEVK